MESGMALAEKLGITPGHVVCLLNAPTEAATLIRQECSEGSKYV
jgi:hypothetical protein